MRFAEGMQGVTPILSALPPEATLSRPDGAHSGNPHVRKAVAQGEVQHMAWAYDRPGGGRSFGFTGGHYHWNWGRPEIRRLVANAILWSVNASPSESDIGTIGVTELSQGQDEPIPQNFDAEKIKSEFKLTALVGETKAVVDGNSKSVKNNDPRSIENAVSGLTVHPGLQATLSAAEPDLKSLTNIDIDHRGRIWVCDVMNYRKNNGRREEGDRILILEDTNQDGVIDKVKTFYQGRDIDSLMGICVLGNEVIVSASPNIWRFIDEDGDDQPDRKEAMFTNTGQPQHDHSAHSFIFGPDGRLYWNFGNTGKGIHDAQGKVVVDRHGRKVIDNGKPFFGGMVFRCERDGSGLEVLGHNFRNNYEVAVDSFGRMWQSDNDDDGNRGVRINYVIEQGNYGYRDELTGAGWQVERIGWESEVPLRHWHLNDPGVMPNLLQTGAGSPTGITVYENRLLPKVFHDQVIHCDAGPNVVRAYPLQTSETGYSATTENLVVGENDQWFRPADACVAPDGSLFVSDWYDPGVGGHLQGDIDRGRLFRFAPPGAKYVIPTYDYSTAEGAIAALRNPCLSVRFLAWTALHKMGTAAEAALQGMWKDEDPRMRARALWLLGRIEGRGQHWVDQALADKNPEIRGTGIRLARQLGIAPTEIARKVAGDADTSVRIEALVSLRFDTSPDMPKRWAELASKYDGRNRWYLETLGLASDLRANECFAAWQMEYAQQSQSAAGRDIAWRVRADGAGKWLGEQLSDSSLDGAEADRYFRALEYHAEGVREVAMRLALEKRLDKGPSPANDLVAIRALERIPKFDPASDERTRSLVKRRLDGARGTAEFLGLARKFPVDNLDDALLDLALKQADNSTGVSAVEMLLTKSSGEKKLTEALAHQSQSVRPLTRLLGLLGKPPAIRMLIDTLLDGEQAFSVRADATRGLAISNLGQKRILELAKENRFPAELKVLAGGLLVSIQDQDLKRQVGELFPQPKTASQAPLPPLDQLAQRTGDAARGQELYKTKGTCSNCHIVQGQGKMVGPDLSEIGTKLPREALYVSILDPSAGISHNFETYQALLDSGQTVSGVLVSQDAEAITLRTAEAIDRKLPRAEVESFKKSEKSVMPDNLHQLVSEQELVDLVEYLTTLKKK
jgi:putative membrane-bound dehydrogenase-like protein